MTKYGKMKIKDINLQFQDMDFSQQGKKDVREIMETIRSGKKIPPILVNTSGYLQDGRHRLQAYINLGYKEVDVEYGYHPAAKVVRKK
jgi:ParB-like chromosome segregation protein Spo0J